MKQILMKTTFRSDLKTVTFSGVANLRKPNLSGSYVQYNENSVFPKPNETRHISSITSKRRDYLDITQRSTTFKGGKLTTSFICKLLFTCLYFHSHLLLKVTLYYYNCCCSSNFLISFL